MIYNDYAAIIKILFLKYFKNLIKNQKKLFWNLFHPDNLLVFEYANAAERIGWEYVSKKLHLYKSICELGCVNGRITSILKDLIADKKYIGYDLNFFGITVAKIRNIFNINRNLSFKCKNAFFACEEKSELFVSIGTVIYFSEKQLLEFLKKLKLSKSFKSFIMHEIFLDESLDNGKSIFVKDKYLHSISKIKTIFGKDYKINVIPTSYPIWETKGRISAILVIEKSI